METLIPYTKEHETSPFVYTNMCLNVCILRNEQYFFSLFYIDM